MDLYEGFPSSLCVHDQFLPREKITDIRDGCPSASSRLTIVNLGLGHIRELHSLGRGEGPV